MPAVSLRIPDNVKPVHVLRAMSDRGDERWRELYRARLEYWDSLTSAERDAFCDWELSQRLVYEESRKHYTGRAAQ